MTEEERSKLVVPESMAREREEQLKKDRKEGKEPPIVFEVILRVKGEKDRRKEEIIGECHGLHAILLKSIGPGQTNYQCYANIPESERTRIVLFLLAQEMLPMGISGIELALHKRAQARQSAMERAPVVVKGGGKKLLDELGKGAPSKRRRR